MNENITILEVQDFLEDFKENSETIILEEGKEKNEIIAIAKAKGIILKDSLSLGGFKNIYAFANIKNKNNARLPKAQLLKVLPTIIGKPVDIDHVRGYVIGHYIDYRYKEKEDMIIAYGVFYKANFKDEWDKVKALFKAKKLATSYEIFCPKNKYKHLEDGTYELTEMEIAGGAILFRESPAFDDAKVLEIARHSLDEQPADLVYASVKKYRCKDIIIAENKGKMSPCSNCGLCNSAEDDKIDIEIKKVESPIPVVVPVVNKIKCSNCGEEFIKPIIETIKCSKCFAILDQTGQMLYPPQIIDFKIGCPSCQVTNWRLVSKAEDKAKIKCMSCTKEYEIIFSTEKTDDRAKIISQVSFVYTRNVTCHQCGKSIPILSTSNLKNKILKCNKCGLTFNYDISNQDRYKQIAEINEIISSKDLIDKIEKSSEGGQKNMKIRLEVSKFHRYVEDYDSLQKSMWMIDTVEEGKDAEAKVLRYQERKALPDSMFAVVLRVKHKITGKIRKIRMYPIQDEAHVRNALARLGQERPKATLQKLGVGIEKVRAKILRRARQLKMTELLKRYEKADDNIDMSAFPKEVTDMVKKLVKEGTKPADAVKKAWKEYKKAHPEKASEDKEKESELPIDIQYEATFDKTTLETSAKETSDDKYRSTIRKAVRKIIDLKKETTLVKASVSDKEIALKVGIRKVVRKLIDVKKDSKEKIKFYQENAKTIYERREELGEEFASELSDKDILDDNRFAGLKAEKENVELRANLETSSEAEVVGSKTALKSDGYYEEQRKKIDKVAFGDKDKE